MKYNSVLVALPTLGAPSRHSLTDVPHVGGIAAAVVQHRVIYAALPCLRHVRLPPDRVDRDWHSTRRDVPILLQKCFVFSVNSDSVALMRFAMEAVDDGAAESRSGAIFLFIPS